MNKITFLGAGSSVFAKNVLGDCLQTDCLREYEYALFDIDADRLEESYMLYIAFQRCSSTVQKQHSDTDFRAVSAALFSFVQVAVFEPNFF